jgi:putative peptide zinc metalloprotease protein
MEDFYRDIRSFEIKEFKTAQKEEHFLICYNDRYFEVNKPIADLVQVLQTSDSTERAAILYSQMRGKNYSKENIEHLIEQCIKSTFLKKDKKEKTSFLFHIDLIPASNIRFLTNRLKCLFKPSIILFFACLSVILDVLFLLDFNHPINFSNINVYILSGIIGLFLFSTFIHEIGHASACKYFELDHGNIGFGIYLIIPVFYTDVSNVWKLPRKQRILVNFAGIYFQLMLLIPFFVIYYYTDNDLIKYFLFITNVNFLITLNPLVKFDGYWILSDLLGIPNLREESFKMISYLFKKIKGQTTKEKPVFLKINPVSRIAAIIYTIIVNSFFFYFFCYIIPDFFYRFFQTMPEHTRILFENLANGTVPANLLYIVLTKLLTFALIIYLIVRILTPIIKQMRK